MKPPPPCLSGVATLAGGHDGAGRIRSDGMQRPASAHSHNLDVLRALAVCFVVASHVLIEHTLTRLGVYHVQSLGTLGVLIFFVHTCLVLMQSLERQHGAMGRKSMALSFFVMRVFRIYPMSIVVVLIVSFVERLSSSGEPTLSTLVSNVLLVQNVTGAPSVTPVLWSLPYEVQMYLFLPGLFVLAQVAGRYAWCWIVALWLSAVVLVLLVWRTGLNYDLIKFFPCFLPGVLAYSLRNTSRRCSAATLFILVWSGVLAFPLLVGIGMSATVLSWFFCLALGSLLPRCRELRWPLLHRVGATLARYSYGIYLVHVPVLHFAFQYCEGVSRIVSWILFVFGVMALSYLAYHGIEKPGIAYGRALARRFESGWARTTHRA